MSEKKLWDDTKKLLNKEKVTFGSHWSFNYLNDPKRLAFVLSRYKFAYKMIKEDSSILELGCSEGIGSTILKENSKKYLGIDFDKKAIDAAKKNFSKNDFISKDFMNEYFGDFDAVISLDVIEHIEKKKENIFMKTILKNLKKEGILIIGTPNISSKKYASKPSQIGHINLYSQKRLFNLLKKYFHFVFPFSMNDEILHTGFSKMGHYLIFLACEKKNEK